MKSNKLKNINAYCSWCFKKTIHKLVNKNVLRRNIYECQGCKNKTVECRYCSEMAKGEPSKDNLNERGLKKITQNWDNELCAEHDGTIASFPNLTLMIDDITEYKQLFVREKKNLSKIGKYTGVGVAGIVSVAGIAASSGSAAPAIAAALGQWGLLGAAGTGATISTLSGAALTSASLAALGGSVAVGTGIISATGLALGGIQGGVIANQYFSEDKSFAISKLKTGASDTRTIFINGFTQENEVLFQDWQDGQNAYDDSHSLYSVNWSAKTNAKLGIAFSKTNATQLGKILLVEAAKKGSKTAAKKLNPLGWLSLFSDLAGNPWHSTMFRAAQTGIQLAEALSRTQGKTYNLVGHSLGCRVIYYALEALSTKSECFIDNVIFLGGAIGKDDNEGWSKVTKAVGGKIYNCHSKGDNVLSMFYKTANAGLSNPIGLNPISLNHDKIINVNCDSFVSSHFKWKESYEHILRLINDDIK